jgi:hypothetical protein
MTVTLIGESLRRHRGPRGSGNQTAPLLPVHYRSAAPIRGTHLDNGRCRRDMIPAHSNDLVERARQQHAPARNAGEPAETAPATPNAFISGAFTTIIIAALVAVVAWIGHSLVS